MKTTPAAYSLLGSTILWGPWPRITDAHLLPFPRYLFTLPLPPKSTSSKYLSLGLPLLSFPPVYSQVSSYLAYNGYRMPYPFQPFLCNISYNIQMIPQTNVSKKNIYKQLHTPRITDNKHTRQIRRIQEELAFTLTTNATKPNPFKIILQSTRKKINWKT